MVVTKAFVSGVVRKVASRAMTADCRDSWCVSPLRLMGALGFLLTVGCQTGEASEVTTERFSVRHLLRDPGQQMPVGVRELPPGSLDEQMLDLVSAVPECVTSKAALDVRAEGFILVVTAPKSTMAEVRQALAEIAHSSSSSFGSPAWRADVPRTWDEVALASLELPNAATGVSARHVSSEFYYGIPATTVFRSFPVYHPDREPAGYRDGLAQAQPEVVFDAGTLHTKQEWIDAGEQVFHWPINLRPFDEEALTQMRQTLAAVPTAVASDGTLPYYRFVVREPGKVEIGTFSCAMCHSRVMEDGSVIVGAQGNLPFDRFLVVDEQPIPDELARAGLVGLFGMPAVPGALPPFPPGMSSAEITAAFRAIPPGVLARHGTSVTSPVQVPDLIGIEGRRYLDRTGLVRHRGIGDLMRYAALNQDLDLLSDYGGFVPDLAGVDAMLAGPLPPGAPSREELHTRVQDPKQRFRYSDEQLYALSLFVYSLQPPSNPNANGELARRGQEVFEAEGCARCHTPPLYTSNELVPAPGFRVPDALRESEAIRSRGVDTDGRLTMSTRRGTGFYKVPSLLGVWYRGPFGHDGSAATLEEWFDPARLREDHVPRGWNPGGGPRAILGHEFGLDLDERDRAALLAFLRTL